MSLTEGGVALLPLMNAEGLNLEHKRVPQPCHGYKTEFYNTPLHLMALTHFFLCWGCSLSLEGAIQMSHSPQLDKPLLTTAGRSTNLWAEKLSI